MNVDGCSILSETSMVMLHSKSDGSTMLSLGQESKGLIVLYSKSNGETSLGLGDPTSPSHATLGHLNLETHSK
jgi:hypothetical protein